jgi:hypothetical protein
VGPHAAGGELVEELCVQGPVEPGGVVVRERLRVALGPVAQQVAVERRRPPGAALEEREPQVGMAATGSRRSRYSPNTSAEYRLKARVIAARSSGSGRRVAMKPNVG